MTTPFTTRLKPIFLAALLAIGAVGATTAFAQSTPPAAPGATPAHPQAQPQAQRGMRHDQRHHAASPERMQQHMAQRAAALKAQLKIEPAQESAWTTFIDSMKPSADAFKRRQEIRAEMQKLTTPERVDRMRVLRTERQARMDKRGDAVKTFYAALNAEQKKTFDSRPMMQGRGGHGGKQGGEHGGHRGRMHGDMGSQHEGHAATHGQSQS
jgi:periplasmic protein CpxP/Spy